MLLLLLLLLLLFGQVRSQDFSWEVASKYLIDDTPCMQVPTTQEQSVEPTGLTEIGATVNDRGEYCRIAHVLGILPMISY